MELKEVVLALQGGFWLLVFGLIAYISLRKKSQDLYIQRTMNDESNQD